MGNNATVVVYTDALDAIANDPQFGKNLASAISRVSCYEKHIDVPSGCHVNAAMVVDVHHADFFRVIAVGGNLGKVLGHGGHWDNDNEQILKRLAEEMGYRLVRKSTKK